MPSRYPRLKAKKVEVMYIFSRFSICVHNSFALVLQLYKCLCDYCYIHTCIHINSHTLMCTFSHIFNLISIFNSWTFFHSFFSFINAYISLTHTQLKGNVYIIYPYYSHSFVILCVHYTCMLRFFKFRKAPSLVGEPCL